MDNTAPATVAIAIEILLSDEIRQLQTLVDQVYNRHAGAPTPSAGGRRRPQPAATAYSVAVNSL